MELFKRCVIAADDDAAALARFCLGIITAVALVTFVFGVGWGAYAGSQWTATSATVLQVRGVQHGHINAVLDVDGRDELIGGDISSSAVVGHQVTVWVNDSGEVDTREPVGLSYVRFVLPGFVVTVATFFVFAAFVDRRSIDRWKQELNIDRPYARIGMY